MKLGRGGLKGCAVVPVVAQIAATKSLSVWGCRWAMVKERLDFLLPPFPSVGWITWYQPVERLAVIAEGHDENVK